MSPKFLSGGHYTGAKVPVCFYWREDLTTDVTEDVTPIIGRNNSGQCIANSYFKREDITCFNAGDCNGEGKCLPCSKYSPPGMKLGISHSPPLDIAKEFDRGLADLQLQSPQQKITSAALRRVSQDQVPYHIIIRNVQAEIAKCCHWNAGDGQPDQFFLANIIDGPESRQITDVNGNQATIKGIVVTNNSFPDEVGTFFPVGTVVVAGFVGRPSFYLEPRTGLLKEGDGIIFPGTAEGTVIVESKDAAQASVQLLNNTVDAIDICRDAAIDETVRVTDFFNNISSTNNVASIATAQAKLDVANANFALTDEAKTAATTLSAQGLDQVSDVLAATTRAAVQTSGKQLSITLDLLALEAEKAAGAVGGTTQADIATFMFKLLKDNARSLRFSGFGAFSKCDFFFEDPNAAATWNAPEDGSLPCNGMRSDCAFYTGPVWEFATNDKMEIGQPITVEQIQEVRFHSDDWSRFTDPAAEFQERFAFSAPFLWAFKGYVDVPFIPAVEDMLLYRPRVLHSRGTSEADFETIEVEKVSISNFTDFAVSRSRSRIQPGSETLDTDRPPEYPDIIKALTVSKVNSISIKHPRKADEPFIYRSWDPDNNTTTLFGTATPEVTIYVVNETSLQERARYNTFYDSPNITNNLPTSLPGSPTFVGAEAAVLIATFDLLEEEQKVSTSKSPLGFHKTFTDREGGWSSINQVDLIHNKINQIRVFAIIGENVLVDSIKIDYRFLHSIIQQTSFEGKDFSMTDSLGESQLGAITAGTEDKGLVKANPQQMAGASREVLSFNQGYFAWRNKDRNLQLGTVNTSSDLRGGTAISDQSFSFVVTESDASTFIINVGYQVVQYRKEITITDWYLINDCSDIMLKVDDLNAHRVLPLPDSSGNDNPLPNVLINNGATGSEVAQWAFESVTLNINGENKNLVQVYRETDGVGLPANYVVVGPDSTSADFFGRPTMDNATITATITFLRAQTAGVAVGETSDAELTEEVLSLNFHGDNLRGFNHKVEFSSSGDLTAGGDGEDSISLEQQEYVWVFQDSDGRPIGRKYSRMMVMYFNIAALNVELFYQWTGTCTTYVLVPDVFLDVGNSSGQLEVSLGGTVDPGHSGLTLGSKVAGFLGTRDCVSTPICADHEFSPLAGVRNEFEVIAFTEEFPKGKAFYPNAGQTVPPADSLLVERPGDLFLIKRGAMWYPYTSCETPRYNFKTGGPLHTDSTERINDEIIPPGIDATFIESSSLNAEGNVGTYGGVKPTQDEAYRGPDRVTPLILDMHPSLRACTSAYSYGNKILTGGESLFTGYARVRGAIDLFWYKGLGWSLPIFGNFGRNRLIFEVSEKRGDYLGGKNSKTVGFRWMPMFPEREDLGASISLFGENIEPQHYRLLANKTPVGEMSESVPADPQRFTHKSLIVNKTAGAIEYPFSPYFPMFLPDSSIGTEEGNSIVEGDQTGTISTMWAWREQETPIKRGQNNSSIIKGIQVESPDYALDHRRLEVRLRPSEGDYKLKFTPGTYNLNGTVATNAKLSLGEGPLREIAIDFVSKSLTITSDGIYDTSRELGEEEGDIPCTSDTPSQTTQLANLCSCIQDEEDTELTDTSPTKLPARFQHLDELSPGLGFFALYDSEEINIPFAVDIPRENELQPCCFCIYYITGIHAKINLDFLPTTRNIDPAFDQRVGNLQYTWSRVPHGYPVIQEGQDNLFGGLESRTDNYLQHTSGSVFVQRFVDIPNQSVTPESSQVSAFFPGRNLAILANSLGNPITVSALSSGDPLLHGGVAANLDGNLGVSQGQDESINLDFLFETYVSVTKVTIGFITGIEKDFKGVGGLDIAYEVPLVELRVIDPPNRTGNSPSTRVGRKVGQSFRTAQGLNIPDLSGTVAFQLANTGHLLFEEEIIPSYLDVPFWDKYGQEFHLNFAPTDPNFSMGIAYIQLEVESMVATQGETIVEDIFITERKYYTSTGFPAGGQNPEQYLSEVDSASAYWRTSQTTSVVGGNRFRAYAWGSTIEDNQPTSQGNIEDLEILQKKQWNDARGLVEAPYQFAYDSFIPLDEKKFLEFLGETILTWQLSLSMEISEIDKIGAGDSLTFGVLPVRQRWNAPGHAWTFDMEENYLPCRADGPTEQVVNFNFAHLHDGLAIVETARFWEELPSGFTRLIMSTLIAADVTFQGGITGGSSGDIVLLDASLFPEEVTREVLENANFVRNEAGDIVILANRGV